MTTYSLNPDLIGKHKGIKRGHPEDDLHKSVAEFLRHALPHNIVWSTISHGGFHLPKHVGARLKALGLRAGIPDLMFIHPVTGVAHFIELKAPGGAISPEQRGVHAALLNSHSPVTVARSINQVEHFPRASGFQLIARAA